MVKGVAPQPSIRLLTLLVSTGYAYSNGVLVRASLRHVAGVHTVVADPRSHRVWVFADGSVDVQGLSDALARWSLQVDVLDDCVVTPA
jgi:hypothetical protein